jgi:transcriptional regulator with XRE-family HTH domain
MPEYSQSQIFGAGKTLKPLQQNAVEVLRDIDSGYDTQQEVADRVGLGRSTVSKYMNAFKETPVPLIEILDTMLGQQNMQNTYLIHLRKRVSTCFLTPEKGILL